MDIDVMKYGCGHDPRVGDLIEFGTRGSRMLVTFIDEEGTDFIIHCGDREFESYSLSMMTLIGRMTFTLVGDE